jgi:hypothetical protein
VVAQFLILLLLGTIFLVGGLLWNWRNNRVAKDRSLLYHPDPTIQWGFLNSVLFYGQLTTTLILCGVIAIVVAFGILLFGGPPHPPA